MTDYPNKGGHQYGYGGGYGQSNTAVVTTQPNVVMVSPSAPPPNNYMAFAIFSCLCCVWPIGIAAIIFSSMSSDAARAGDYEGARTKGKVSLGLSIASVILGAVAVIIILVVYFTVGFGYYYYNV